MGSGVGEVLSPTTDAGVVRQVVGLLVVMVSVMWLVRRERVLVTFTVGVALVLLGFIGLGGLH